MPIHIPFQQKKSGSKVPTYKDMKKRSSIAIESPEQAREKFEHAKLKVHHESEKFNPSKIVMLVHHH